MAHRLLNVAGWERRLDWRSPSVGRSLCRRVMVGALTAGYAEALRGDLRPLVRLSEPSAPWSPAARALWWFSQPGRAVRPTVAEAVAATPEVRVEALAHLARVALLELDLVVLKECEAHLARDPHGVSPLWGRIVSGWRAGLGGDGDTATGAGAEVYALASERGLPVLAVEATTLSAIGAMARGDIAAATAIARRASRMAQTEHLWLSHYFCSVLLARLRRLGGRPHLASLVAAACLEVTSPVFHGWLLWERVFAGAELTLTASGGPVGQAAAYAARLLEGSVGAPAPDASPAATDVEPDSWTELERLVADSVFHARDAAVLREALSLGTQPLHCDGWLAGHVHDVPAEISGLTPPAWADAVEAAPVALGLPGAPAGRRMLGFAVDDTFARLRPHGVRVARPEAVAAALALAGETGVELPALFQAVYGFPYRRDVHEATFKVERSRARKVLDGVATMELAEGRLTLRVQRPFAVPDPRCHKPLPDVLLRHLAAPAGKTARELAESLDIPLRTVQHALKQLTADGACVTVKEGRRVAYAVEDTTFCEVTVV